MSEANISSTSASESSQIAKSRWMMTMPSSETPETSFFDEINVIDFLNRYENLCNDFRLENAKKARRLSRYCDVLIDQSVKIIDHWILRDWKTLKKLLLKEYKVNDVAQKIYSRRFLKMYKDKTRIDTEDIRQFCRRYLVSSNNLIKKDKLDKTTRITWFIQGLPDKMQTKLFLHHQIDLKDLEAMNFDNLMKKTLIIAKANRRLKEIRNLNKKEDKLSDLTDRCDNREALSLTEKKEIFSLTISIAQPIRALNRRAEKNHNRRMNEITSVMNAMTLAMRVESTQSFMSQRYNSNSTKSTIQQENNANVRVSNVAANQCMYCEEKNDHQRRKDCPHFQSAVRIDRIHLDDDYRIHAESLETSEPPMRMQYDLTQKKCVERQTSSVSRSPVASIEVRTVRVEDLEPEFLTTNDELSEDEDAKDLKIEITKSILVESVRAEETKANNSWIESSRGILKRKTKDESKFAASKTTRFEDWVNTNKEKTEVFDLLVKGKSFELRETNQIDGNFFVSRSNYVPTSRSFQADVSDMNDVKMRDASKTKKPTKQASINSASINSEKRVPKSVTSAMQFTFDTILQSEVRLDLVNLIDLCSLLQKMFAQRYRVTKNAQRNVEGVHVESIGVADLDFKNYYIAFTLKIPVRMKSDTRYVALLNTGAEVNVMIEEMMHKEDLSMRSRSALNLISHIDHQQKFLSVCEDVKISIENFIIKHHIFVIARIDHVLILDQPFLLKSRASTKWRNEEIDMTTHDSKTERQAVFRIIVDSNSFFYRDQNEIFSSMRDISLQAMRGQRIRNLSLN
jgi:hypothetical protein